MFTASFDLCCYRRTFLFQVHVVEILYSAVLSYSNFHFADHSIGLGKIDSVPEIKFFMLIFGVPSSKGGGCKFIPGRRVWQKLGNNNQKLIIQLSEALCWEHSCGMFLWVWSGQQTRIILKFVKTSVEMLHAINFAELPHSKYYFCAYYQGCQSKCCSLAGKAF